MILIFAPKDTFNDYKDDISSLFLLIECIYVFDMFSVVNKRMQI